MKNGVLVATKPHIGVTKHKTCCLRYQQIRILVIQAQTPEFGDLPTALWFQEWGFRKGESSPSFLGESPSRRVGWLSMMDRDRFFSWFHHDKKWGGLTHRIWCIDHQSWGKRGSSAEALRIQVYTMQSELNGIKRVWYILRHSVWVSMWVECTSHILSIVF